MGFAGPGGGSNAYGVGSDGVAGGLSQQTNFTMQNEDFPALPGSGPGAPSSRVGVGGLHQSMPLTSGFRGDEAGGSSSGHGAAVRGNVSAAIVGSSRASNVPRQTAPSSGDFSIPILISNFLIISYLSIRNRNTASRQPGCNGWPRRGCDWYATATVGK